MVTTSFVRSLLDAERTRAASHLTTTGRCLSADGTEVVGREATMQVAGEPRAATTAGRLAARTSIS